MARTKIPVEFSSTPGIVDNSSATAITIDSAGAATFNGNVGIGTAAPTVELDVYGDGSGVSVGRPWGNDSYVSSGYFGKQANTGGWGAGSAFMKIEDSLTTGVRKGTSIDFVTHNYGVGNQTTMSLTGNGNIGIGTDAPTQKLEVAMTRTSSTSGIVLQLSDNVTGAQTDGVYKAIRSASNAGNSISEIRFLETDGTNNNTSISFATAATAGGLTERVRINQLGNVGIGTSSPNGTGFDENATVLSVNGYYRGIIELGSNNNVIGDMIGGIEFRNTASTEAYVRAYRDSNGDSEMRLGAHHFNFTSGNVGIGTTSPLVKLDVLGSPSAPATSGTAQTGSLRVSQTAGNGVLDMGFYTSATGTAWLQSTNKSNLATNYGLTLQPNGGNVGIGTASPGSLLDVTRSDGTAYSAANTLVSGQWMRISNPNSAVGIASTLLFETTGGGGGNGLATISGVQTGTGSAALTFGTRLSNGAVTERMRIASDGIITHNGVSTYSNAVYMVNNVQYSFDINVGDEGGAGNVFEVHAMYDHFYNFGYGASLITLVGKRGNAISQQDIKVITTANGGSWTLSATATVLTLTKTAGTYPGGGYGHIMVRFYKA